MHALLWVLLGAVGCIATAHLLELVLSQVVGWWRHEQDTIRPGSRSGLGGDV